MKNLDLGSALLRLQLALRAAGPVAIAALVLCAAGMAALGWVVPARERLEAERAAARSAARLPPPAAAPLTVGEDADTAAHANLALFYGALGQPRQVAQQLDTLFALAAKTGLSLRQGEYKKTFDRQGRLHTYQVNLPVKGTYGQVWRFALAALRAIPFASLDEVSFRRENIGEAGLEARLRLTLYLTDAVPQSGSGAADTIGAPGTGVAP